jgi:hypothetical protein
MRVETARAPAFAPPPLQALRRIGRKGEVPSTDLRLIFRDTLGGDQVVQSLVSNGYASEQGGVLRLTDAGRRKLDAEGWTA